MLKNCSKHSQLFLTHFLFYKPLPALTHVRAVCIADFAHAANLHFAPRVLPNKNTNSQFLLQIYIMRCDMSNIYFLFQDMQNANTDKIPQTKKTFCQPSEWFRSKKQRKFPARNYSISQKNKNSTNGIFPKQENKKSQIVEWFRSLKIWLDNLRNHSV